MDSKVAVVLYIERSHDSHSTSRFQSLRTLLCVKGCNQSMLTYQVCEVRSRLCVGLDEHMQPQPGCEMKNQFPCNIKALKVIQ